MDAAAEGAPKPSSKMVDLSIIKNPEIREFTAEQVPKLDWLTNKDALAGIPPVKFNFHFSAHGSPEDIKGWQEHIQQTDIWIPEMKGWPEIAKQVFESVSDGREKPIQALETVGFPKHNTNFSMRLEELGFLYNTGIPTEFIDISSNQLANLPPAIEYPHISGKKFKEMMSLMRKRAESGSDILIMREVIMLSNLRNSVLEAVEKKPDLKSKDQLNVLLTLGSSHTWVYQMLEKHGFNVSRDFSVNPMIFGFEAEAFRNIRYGKALNDELVANTVFSDLIDAYMSKDIDPDDNFDNITPFLRRASEAFSIEEKAALYDSCMTSGTNAPTASAADSEIHSKIVAAFYEKGIIFAT